jgi:hypothetical protein
MPSLQWSLACSEEQNDSQKATQIDRKTKATAPPPTLVSPFKKNSPAAPNRHLVDIFDFDSFFFLSI